MDQSAKGKVVSLRLPDSLLAKIGAKDNVSGYIRNLVERDCNGGDRSGDAAAESTSAHELHQAVIAMTEAFGRSQQALEALASAIASRDARGTPEREITNEMIEKVLAAPAIQKSIELSTIMYPIFFDKDAGKMSIKPLESHIDHRAKAWIFRAFRKRTWVLKLLAKSDFAELQKSHEWVFPPRSGKQSLKSGSPGTPVKGK